MGYGPCGEVLQVATHLLPESASAAAETSNVAKKKIVRFIRWSISCPNLRSCRVQEKCSCVRLLAALVKVNARCVNILHLRRWRDIRSADPRGHQGHPGPSALASPRTR